jgi:hypothetical protein
MQFSGELAAATGDRPRALQALQEKIFEHDHGVGMDFRIARLQAILGNDEASIDWLEKSLVTRDANLAMVDVDPRFDRLRSHPRFQALLRRMKLVSAQPVPVGKLVRKG